ncbi:MAG: GGDEF domain-containing protein, partial [Spirochaetales bacterium]|nr:GGDEF domain-containing protein [Spirochaetales bacterium]
MPRVFVYFAAATIALSVLSFAFFAVFFQTRKAEYEQSALMDARYTSNAQSISMTEILNNVLADLLYLSDAYETRTTQFPQEELKDMLAADFLLYCQRKKIYDQIRVVDINGMEQIRVNYNSGYPSIVPRAELQDKSGRYYFDESIVLGEHSLYLSPIDLNVENGVIEVPNKPMLRIAKPLFVNGEKKGVIILNFLAKEFLENTFSLNIGQFRGSQHILNRDSYILRYDRNPDLEFAFMYPEREQITFKDLYPEENEAVFASMSGSLRSNFGLFVWETIAPITDILTGEPDYRFVPYVNYGNEYFWKLVFIIDDKNLSAALAELRQGFGRLYLTILGPIIVISALAAWLVNRNRDYRIQIERMAQYDGLTGLPNRQLLEDIGEKQLALAQRQKSLVGILFLDLDGFKQVNDTRGHAAGDEILREMGRRIPAV